MSLEFTRLSERPYLLWRRQEIRAGRKLPHRRAEEAAGLPWIVEVRLSLRWAVCRSSVQKSREGTLKFQGLDVINLSAWRGKPSQFSSSVRQAFSATTQDLCNSEASPHRRGPSLR